MPSWPSTLPNPSEPYDIMPVDGRVATDMESGTSRVRRRFTGMPTYWQLSWFFNTQQKGIFEAWYKHILKDGVEYFDIYLFTGLGYQLVSCQFSGMWSSKVVGPDHFVVSAVLTSKTRPIMTSSQLQPYL